MHPAELEAYNAVNKINEELSNKYKFSDYGNIGDELIPNLSITFCQSCIFITVTFLCQGDIILPEILLYNSENDDRIYYHKSDKSESYYKYIKRKFRLIKEAINKIKI